MATINIKRIYEPAAGKDGLRILVDRLWPRGIKKEAAGLDGWIKDVAPTPQLRKWFNHDVAKWEEFKARYNNELKENGVVKQLFDKTKAYKTITLLYAAHDEQHNHAIVLQHFLNSFTH